MPLWNDFDELIIDDTLSLDAVGWQGSRLSVKFGDGFGAEARNGAESGLLRWTASDGGVWTDNANYNDLVAGVPTFQYYEQFIRDHINGDSSIFWFEYRGKKYHAAFVNPGYDAERLTSDLFSVSGLEIEQRRVQGVAYNDDGSIYEPWAWLSGRSVVGVSDNTAFTPWPDVGGVHDFSLASLSGGTGPKLQTNEVNSLPIVEFTTDGASCAVTSLTVRNIWLVCKVREATFGSDRVLISDDATTNVLAGEAGTTKFEDGGYGAGFTYKLNGTSYASSNQQAPMSAYGVVHMRWEYGFNFLAEVNLGCGTGGGAEQAPIDVAEFIIDNAEITSSQADRVSRMLKDVYGL